LRDLPAAAAAEGSPDDLTRHELAAYTVRTLAESFILRPMEFAIRIQNRLGYAAIALILLLPVPPLAWAARRERRETPVPTQGTT
jgi:hypothetical protein